MKLKRILAGVLTGAMMITGIPAFGLEASLPVYADEPADSTGAAGVTYTNLAAGKAVRTAGTEEGAASNVTDGKADTVWKSADLNKVSPQYLEIDLQDIRSNIDHIKLNFGTAWDGTYTVYTYENKNGANTTWHTVKTVGTNGPDGTIASDAGIAEGRTGNVDTIVRNGANERIVLRRFLRIEFTKANAAAGTHVSVAEVEINGTTSQRIYGPAITVKVPQTGEFAEAAVVKADENNAAYHTNLRDRTVPSATLLKGGLNNTDDIPVDSITDDMLLNKGKKDGETGTDYDYEMYYADGTYGFNAQARTPGSDNKFRAESDKVKIISFQLYLKKPAPDNGDNQSALNIFGNGERYAVQIQKNGIQVYTKDRGANGNGTSWPTDRYAISDSDWNTFINKWHDVMIVFDGKASGNAKGRMRIYVDGAPGTSNANAITYTDYHSGEANRHFTLGYNEACPRERQAFTSEYGYIARLKFYTNADLEGHVNGAGTDLSDAKTLSDAAVEKINLQTLESADKANAYKVISNVLQKEEPTLRVTLCPYNRKTIWQKYADNAWTDMAADETFADNTKYRAVTTLETDDGYIFDSECRARVAENMALDGTAAEGTTLNTVKVESKNRKLVATTYFNLENGKEDPAVEAAETCSIEEVIIGDESIYLTYDGTDGATQTETEIDMAEARVGELCADHQDATADIAYALSGASDGTNENDYVKMEVDEATKKIKLTPKKVSKKALGYEPISITVTATLKDASGNVITEVGGSDPIAETGTIQIFIDGKKSDQVIDVAPAVTVQSPKAGEFPQVAELAIPGTAKHFEDIDDRMNPAAQLDALTQDYIRTNPYIKEGTVSGGSEPKDPTEQWISQWNNTPVIKNIQGVWGFNAIGQTPGDTNKFDVFGNDIKLVSFKLFLKKWPTRDNTQTNGNPTAVDVYGKGNKYAFQVTSDQTLFMFMEAQNGSWPTEVYTPENKADFLNKWHNIFMVVDGKGWQRLYVDGKPSSTRGGNNNQGSAYAKDPTGYARKPFTLGYNSKSNNPNWYRNIFTEEYGYIADFEFYSDKNYDNITNGAGTDISDAQILDEQLTENINLQQLESKYGDDVGIVLTNMLQESNSAATITATPYVAKTNWSQETSKGSNKFELIDKKNPTAFGYAARYRSTTTLTAYDGFTFKNDESFTNAVKEKFVTEGGADAEQIEVTVGPNAAKEANKVLTITATYGKTEEAPCTCEIEVVTPPAPVEVEIPEDADTATADLPAVSEDDVAITCLKEDHPVAGRRIQFDWAVAEGSEDKIEINAENKLVAKKAGTAALKLTATLQVQNEDSQWVTYQNGEGEDVTTTINVTVTVTKAGAAAQEDLEALEGAADQADADYPESVKDDYTEAAWNALQDAITAARELASNPNATAAQVTAAAENLQNAISALANAKSPKGLAKDALKAVLDNAELKALIEGNNSDKKYTAESYKALTDAYTAAQNGLTTADAATLGALKTALETAWKSGLKEAQAGPGGNNGGSGVKDGEILTGADGSKYQVASAKDKTVIITKGVDAKTIKVGPTVALKGDTYKVIGIGNSAFAGLRKATKVVINGNVTSIGDKAFAKSKKIKNVTIGADVTKIGKQAFMNCTKLSKVILKGTGLTNKSFGKKAFSKTAKKVAVKWGKVKGKQRTQLKKALKKAGMKVK